MKRNTHSRQEQAKPYDRADYDALKHSPVP